MTYLTRAPSVWEPLLIFPVGIHAVILCARGCHSGESLRFASTCEKVSGIARCFRLYYPTRSGRRVASPFFTSPSFLRGAPVWDHPKGLL